MSKSVYGLCFDTDTGPVVFYVGCTDDVARRTREHKNNPFNPNHNEYDTYKYQWCRDLKSLGLDYRLEVLVDAESVDDENDEYAWVLKFARHNQSQGIAFYDDLPLTNMKAGDFLSEMLHIKTINTGADIARYKQEQKQRAVEYTRPSNTFGDQSRGKSRRREVADSMVVITEQKRTEDVLKALEKSARESRRDNEIKKARETSIAFWKDQLVNGTTDDKIIARQMLGLDPLK